MTYHANYDAVVLYFREVTSWMSYKLERIDRLIFAQCLFCDSSKSFMYIAEICLMVPCVGF